MKKQFYVLTLFLLGIGSVLGSPYSPATQRLMHMTEPSLAKASQSWYEVLRRQFSLDLSQGTVSISGLIHVASDFDFQQLNSLEILTYVCRDTIISANIPVRALEALGQLPGVLWVEVDGPVASKMDEARADIQADAVHAGTGLGMAYTGDGVIVGIIDSGFDYTHPAFENENGQSRILKVWDQRDNSGTAPKIDNQTTYGSEYTGQKILLKEHDSEMDGELKTHGTQVAGAAVGRGADSQGIYSGVAPDANIIFVSRNGSAASVMDALDYVFDYAESVNMPAVVNISFGSHQGPHDGTSTVDQYMDRVAGPGKIIVGSAGNEGDLALHVSHTFNGSETIRISPEASDGEVLIDLWGTVSKSFEVSIGLVNAATHAFVAQTAFFSTNDASYKEGMLQGNTSYIMTATNSSPNNQRPNMQIYVENVNNYPVVLQVKSSSGTVHGWSLYETDFVNLGRADLYQAGDNANSILEISATSKSIIAVGAYVTKKEYRDINNSLWRITLSSELYDLADFSSRGPTLDGRIKPDICAPGCMLVIPYSSYTTETIQDYEKVDKVGGFWPYGAFSGTSFSSPIVAGTVALMLEANATLDPDDVKNILYQTAQKDNFTGTTQNNQWGYGKVDAYQAVSKSVNYSGVSETRQPDAFTFYPGYPNPFNPETTLQYRLNTAGKVRIVVYNQKGQEVVTLVDAAQSAGIHTLVWDAGALPSGVYLCRIQTGNMSAAQKLMLIR